MSSDTSTPATSLSHGLKAGTIAAIVIGVAAAFFIIAGGIFYLSKRRATRTTQSDQTILHETDTTPVNFRTLPEMVGTGRVQELGGPDQIIPEMEHTSLPVELQASRSHYQDQRWS